MKARGSSRKGWALEGAGKVDARPRSTAWSWVPGGVPAAGAGLAPRLGENSHVKILSARFRHPRSLN